MAPAQLLVALCRRGGLSPRHLSKQGLGEVALVVNTDEAPYKQEARVTFPADDVCCFPPGLCCWNREHDFTLEIFTLEKANPALVVLNFQVD